MLKLFQKKIGNRPSKVVGGEEGDRGMVFSRNADYSSIPLNSEPRVLYRSHMLYVSSMVNGKVVMLKG